MSTTLFINACVRPESRTLVLADALLDRLEGDIIEVKLDELDIQPLNGETLNLRTSLIDDNDYSHEMFDLAKEFSAADTIVIAAPYWDLSFPSLLKVYIEHIMVNGITFTYTAEGFPVSMSHAQKLFYVSTAGGPVFGGNEGFQYIKQLAEGFFEISDIKLIQAENLDVVGNDPEEIIANTIATLDQYADYETY